ncbi:hypothetical protein [Aeromicrobium sp. UC242_57]
MVRTVHRALVAQGYDGPAPVFDERWDALFKAPRNQSLRRTA